MFVSKHRPASRQAGGPQRFAALTASNQRSETPRDDVQRAISAKAGKTKDPCRTRFRLDRSRWKVYAATAPGEGQCKSFFYQAASWKAPWPVVAKVEFQFGELFPRVEFIVTNPRANRWAVVRLYNL